MAKTRRRPKSRRPKSRRTKTRRTKTRRTRKPGRGGARTKKRPNPRDHELALELASSANKYEKEKTYDGRDKANILWGQVLTLIPPEEEEAKAEIMRAWARTKRSVSTIDEDRSEEEVAVMADRIQRLLSRDTLKKRLSRRGANFRKRDERQGRKKSKNKGGRRQPN